MKKLLLSICLLCVSAFPLLAQWSADFSKNNQITPANFHFDECAVQTNADGVTYVFMMVPYVDHYTMRLQIIDKDGKRVFGSGGNTFSSEVSPIWTKVNQLMMLDKDGNAIIGVQDNRFDPTKETSNYTIYKFASDGRQLWATTLNDSVPQPMQAGLTMCCSDDGGYVFAFAYGSSRLYTQIEKLDNSGKSVWPEPLIIADSEDATIANGAFPFPYLIDAGENQSMLVYVNGGNQDLKVRLIDADSKSVWCYADVTLYSGSYASSRIWQSFSVHPGPDGGVLLAVATADPYAKVSYMTVDGDYSFDHGAEAQDTNDSEYASLKPEVIYDKEENVFYCVYKQLDLANQAYQGLYMQKLSIDGDLLWGDEGKPVLEMQEAEECAYYSIRPAGAGRFAIFYQMHDAESFAVASYIQIYDHEGNLIGGPQNFSTSVYSKEQLGSSSLIDDSYFLAHWCETRSGSSPSLYMQKVPLTLTSALPDVDMGSRRVIFTEVLSADGLRRHTLTDGVNIVRRIYSDHSVAIEKIIK